MITAQDILNEVEVIYPKSVDGEAIEKLLYQIQDNINSRIEVPDYENEDDINVWKWGHFLNIIVDFEDKEEITVIFKGDHRDEFAKHVRALPLLQHYGWFIRNEYPGEILLEPIYPKNKVRVPKYLYHSTRASNVEEILKNGLVPTTSIGKHSWHVLEYPPRVFLSDAPRGITTGSVVLQIDTTAIRGVVFHKDAEWDTGFWTSSYIPPEAISRYIDDTSAAVNMMKRVQFNKK